MDLTDLIIATCGLALGGFLKGATGAGAPVVGVPILAMVVGIQHAVAIFAVINLMSNIWQGWSYRESLADRVFVARFAVSGAVGAALGTVLLASLSTDLLLAGLAGVVFVYIGIRLARPGWQISREQGRQAAFPTGLTGALMQGAGGVSAPVSVTFLNAMRLDRSEFVATISIYFLMMSVTQIPTLIWFDILNWERFGHALVAAIPLFGAMPIGTAAARRISRETFDKIILVLLFLLALRLLQIALT